LVSDCTLIAMTNIAYIDGANLHMGIQSLGKKLDYQKFRKWLFWKYRIETAYIFIGYIPTYEHLYSYLKESGFTLVFKESVLQAGEIKANVDAELVLQAVRDAYETPPKETVIVSGDGDFSCLIDFLREKGTLKTMVAPNKRYCSYLLRKKNIPIVYMDDVITKCEKTPDRN